MDSNDIPPGPYSEHDLRRQWNSQADGFNQWDSLDSSEQLAWAQARAIAAVWRPTPEAAPVATNKEQPLPPHIAITYQPKSVYQPLRPAQPPSPQLTPPAAPAGGLVERVAAVIADDDALAPLADLWHVDARAAIREVAAWIDQQGQHGCSLLLREEVDRG